MSSNKKIYISLIGFLVIFLLFLFLSYLPWLEQIKKNSQDAVFQKQTLFSLRSKEENLKKLGADYINLKPGLEKIENLSLDSNNPVEFLNYVERTASTSGIEIAKLRIIQDKKDPWPFSLQISLTSDFSNFSKFLARLENSPFISRIQSLDLKKINERINVSLLLKVFSK